MNATPGAPMGGNIQERQLVFDVADGSVQLAGIDYGLVTNRQMAGYVHAHTDTGADTMMWLTLDP